MEEPRIRVYTDNKSPFACIANKRLFETVTEPQEAFESGVLSPGDATEIAMRRDFPKA